ncbi:MAG: SDR family NAD(P)-dependent oxidoreductase, partial [Actinomycetota bacterium]|nr:SDR family NAD(P)-dependent oxidoreductase [Actinomycetota bacterium]
MADRSGRTALVSGAGNGLGRAISLALAAAGHRVILVGRNAAPLEQTAEQIGKRARVGLVDVADAGSVAALAADLKDETISVLVNNAGVPGPVKPLVEIEPDEWDDVFAVNVRGIFLMCRAFLPRMIEGGYGDVINLASVSGKRPLALRTPYA